MSSKCTQTSFAGKNKEPQITIIGIQKNNESKATTRLKFESLKFNLLSHYYNKYTQMIF